MKRRALRPLRATLEAIALRAEPPGVLPRAQRLWEEVAGTAVAAETEPISMRDGVLTVRCESAVWAQELELLASEILTRLNATLAPDGAVRQLRFTVGPGPGSPPGSGDL